MSTVPKKNEIVISPSTISTKDIAKYFDVSIKELNKLFLELQWVKRKYFLWLVSTELGKEKGAVKEKREILWNRDLLGDRELIIAIKQSKNFNQRIDPTAYRIQVHKKYKENGYTLWDYIKEKGSYNKNIHFVAKREREVVLIHCKSSDEDITLDEVLEFRKNKQDFLAENPVFEIYNIKLKYVMSQFSISEDAFKYLQVHKDLISYELLK